MSVFLAIAGGDLDYLRELIDVKGEKCDETVRNSMGMTCTMVAVENGHEAILKYLVDEKGAKCDDTIRDNHGFTCTMLAAYQGHEAILRYLVDEKGAKCDDTIRDNHGFTCTMLAVMNGHEAILRYLVENQSCKWDDTIKDEDGKTCFMWAVEKGNVSIVAYLESKMIVESDYEEYEDHTHTITHPVLSCPIYMILMTDPIVASDGHSYQKLSLQRYILHQRINRRPLTSPMDPSVELDPTIMIPNHHLRSLVSEFKIHK